MILIKKYSPEQTGEWNQFNRSSKNSLFMFDRNYMDYHKSRFMDHSLMFYENNHLIAILPMNQKDNVLYSHEGLTYGGFIFDEKMKQQIMLECFGELKRYCLEQNIHKLIYKTIPYIYHSEPAEEDRYALYRNGAYLLKIEPSTVLDLKEPIGMATLRKRQIKKAIKNGVEISIGYTFEDYNTYINLLNEVLHEHHNVNAVHTANEIYWLYSMFPDNISLYMGKYKGVLIAGTILFKYADAVHTQYLASNDAGRSIGALDMTIGKVIEDFSMHKSYLDFGISTENSGKYLNSGLISQKEGFGGRTIVYETWEMEIRADK